MSRSLSAAMKAAVNQQRTTEVPVILITITHADLSGPLYISTDNKDTFSVDGVTVRGTISRGNNYVYCPVRITLPDDSAEAIVQSKMEIDNTERTILATIRGLTTPPTITLEVVLASSPDTVEGSWEGLRLASVDADVLTISGTLTLGSSFGRPFPSGIMGPTNVPGLF